MAGPSILTKWVADTSAMTGEVDKATTGMGGKIKDFAGKAALAIGGAFAVDKVLDFAKQSIDAASDLQESISKVGVVFGKSGDSIVSWSQDAAKSMGMSQQAALEAAGTYGNLAVSLGLPQDKAADMSTSLVQLAADMASFNNVPVDEALQALQSGLTGETEPLKKFGVNLNDAALKAEAMRLGLSNGKGTLDASAKAQASYSLIMQQSTTAQGDFARTSDGLANKTKISAAKFEDLKAKVGDMLLPAMNAIVGVISDQLMPAFEAIGGWISDNLDVFASIGIAIGVVGGVILATMIPSLIAWAAAQWAVVAPLIATYAPIFAIGAAVAAVAYLVIHNWDTIVAATKVAWDAITAAVRFVWDWITQNWPTLLAVLTGPFGVAVLLIVRNWDTIKGAIGAVIRWIGSILPPIAEVLTAPFRIAWQSIKTVWDWIKGAAQGAYDFMVNVFKGLGSAITAPIRIAWNALASVWNSTVGAVSIKIPDFVPGLGGKGFDVPDLPRLAAGAVLTQPTLFIGGEAGTELVTPEAMLRAIIAEEGGSGSTYQLNLYPRTADSSDIAYGFRRLELLAGVG
jgi:hypothetical protein